MNLAEFAAALHDRLVDQLPATVTVVDDLPVTTPAGNYCYVTFDSNQSHRSAACTDRIRHTAYVVCVGFDAAGARFVVDHVRDALLDHRLNGNHQMTEPSVGPQLTDGPEGDRRASITLTYQLITTRSM